MPRKADAPAVPQNLPHPTAALAATGPPSASVAPTHPKSKLVWFECGAESYPLPSRARSASSSSVEILDRVKTHLVAPKPARLGTGSHTLRRVNALSGELTAAAQRSRDGYTFGIGTSGGDWKDRSPRRLCSGSGSRIAEGCGVGDRHHGRAGRVCVGDSWRG